MAHNSDEKYSGMRIQSHWLLLDTVSKRLSFNFTISFVEMLWNGIHHYYYRSTHYEILMQFVLFFCGWVVYPHIVLAHLTGTGQSFDNTIVPTAVAELRRIWMNKFHLLPQKLVQNITTPLTQQSRVCILKDVPYTMAYIEIFWYSWLPTHWIYRGFTLNRIYSFKGVPRG